LVKKKASHHFDPEFLPILLPEDAWGAPSLSGIVQGLWKTAADAGAVEAAVRDMGHEPDDAKV